ncbi:hypothetical protein DL766_001248 [Monosporascus sp. MC13-8B]|uniref:Uncharacterized protein n=1 Tax=Monosporascus cannonballus TaxID=155416 RepID=A0ABY0HB46_9PEZI|nr:hypothetical protein DL762_003693 [Monosporascus cannonballus]RYO96960.1 hypothetical protein DL763_002997 [Monosporascus cannonballus]RYP37951.1 hypothetical protein DL766_001248 [Monosporascus sp. MC13-8B]
MELTGVGLKKKQDREPTGTRSIVSTGSEGSNYTDGKASDLPAQGGKRPRQQRTVGQRRAEDDSDHAAAPAAMTSRSKKRRLSAHSETDSHGERSKKHRRDREASSVRGAADQETSLPNSNSDGVRLRGAGAGEPPARGVAPPIGIHANSPSGGGAATTFQPTTASTTGRGATPDSQLPGSSSSSPSGKPASDSATTILRLPARVPRFFWEVSGSELTLATKHLDGASAEEPANSYGHGGGSIRLSDDLCARARCGTTSGTRASAGASVEGVGGAGGTVLSSADKADAGADMGS